MNTYAKYCPNVWLAKCSGQHEKGEVIPVTTQYGKENECIVFNLVLQKDNYYYYSIVRADGFNYAQHKADKLKSFAEKNEMKSDKYWKAADEGKDFLSLGEPIKIGHHSEKRHRNLIERNHARMDKSIELQRKSEEQLERAKYWERKANTINLSMPESLEYYEFQLEQAKEHHAGLKNKTIQPAHSMSLQYANKAVKELEGKLKTAKLLWE